VGERTWQEFVVAFPADIKEPLTAILFDLGCEGINEEDGMLTAYFPVQVSPEAVREALSAFEGVSSQNRLIEEQDWYAPWKEGFGPFRAAGLVICPPWKECALEQGERLLILDPGQAFGAGDHETTRTVLRMLRAWAESVPDLSGKRFLDLGTGTGILTVAAHIFGFRDITAVDVEERALDTAVRNFELNGIAGDVRLIHGGMENAGTGYDLIAANIFMEALIVIMPHAKSALVEGGTLIVSGLIKGQEQEVFKAAGDAGMEVVETAVLGKWVSALIRA
jgi:ribosomal protein L11 methyltransferase